MASGQETIAGVVSAATNSIVATAQAQLGKPYVWATAGPNTFDCSGLTKFSYHAAGYTLVHNAAAQYVQMKHRPYAQAEPGDVVFFRASDGIIGHCGIYTGNGQMIDAPTEGIPVRYDNVASNPDTLVGSVGYMGDGSSSGSGGFEGAGGLTSTSNPPIKAPTGKIANPSALHTPLTDEIRAKIIAWLLSNGYDKRSLIGDLHAMPSVEATGDPAIITAGMKRITDGEFDSELLTLFQHRAAGGPVTTWKKPTGAHIGGGIVKDVVGWSEGLASLLAKLTDGSFWIRVGEVVLGGTLLIIGIDVALKSSVGFSPVKKFGPSAKKIVTGEGIIPSLPAKGWKPNNG